jgi:hypothetical protein
MAAAAVSSTAKGGNSECCFDAFPGFTGFALVLLFYLNLKSQSCAT